MLWCIPSTPSKQLKCQAKPTQSRQPRVLSVECWASSQRISSAGRKRHYLKASVSFDCPLRPLSFFSVSLLDVYFSLSVFPHNLSLSRLLSLPLFFSFSLSLSLSHCAHTQTCTHDAQAETKYFLPLTHTYCSFMFALLKLVERRAQD